MVLVLGKRCPWVVATGGGAWKRGFIHSGGMMATGAILLSALVVGCASWMTASVCEPLPWIELGVADVYLRARARLHGTGGDPVLAAA